MEERFPQVTNFNVPVTYDEHVPYLYPLFNVICTLRKVQKMTHTDIYPGKEL